MITLNVKEVSKRLLQKYPILLIDKAEDFIPFESCTGIKAVSINEPYFQGHFPGMPIMPGSLIIEAAAQTCALVLSNAELTNVPALVQVEKFKILKPIIPGDVAKFYCKKSEKSGDYLSIFEVLVKVNNTICAKGALNFAFISETNLYTEKE